MFNKLFRIVDAAIKYFCMILLIIISVYYQSAYAHSVRIVIYNKLKVKVHAVFRAGFCAGYCFGHYNNCCTKVKVIPPGKTFGHKFVNKKNERVTYYYAYGPGVLTWYLNKHQGNYYLCYVQSHNIKNHTVLMVALLKDPSSCKDV